ncbi:transposase [Microcystis aeruginosa NIES-843]|uniref:Transposase n=1 Tax=Microcystis aeruginosa (strain NIES-843 / IAM M-2473) TaxID=449447 RepID=B0JJ42_MICAN|nr:transposase [Microcystis aeruginosa NIES-843]
MGLCLLVYTIGQRQLRLSLKQQETGLKNQLGKLTDRPTLRWIFQGFQGIHLGEQVKAEEQINYLTKASIGYGIEKRVGKRQK